MIIRFERNRKKKYGWVVEDRIRVIEGDIFKKGELTVMTGLEIPFAGVQLELPCEPSQVIFVPSPFLEENGGEKSIKPTLIPLEHVIASDQTISISTLPRQDCYYGIGIALAFKKPLHEMGHNHIRDHIMGLTCVLSIQTIDGEVAKVAIGSGILPRATWETGEITLRVNQEEKFQVPLCNLIKEPVKLLGKTIEHFPLGTGDLLCVSHMISDQRIQCGDQVEVIHNKMPYPLSIKIK